MDENTLNLTIRDREKVVFSGDVDLVTSINKKGKFDVLPRHANFVSLVGETLVYRKKDGTTGEIRVDNGVMKVRSNKIIVYLGIKK